MASKSVTARPAARKGQASAKAKKTMAKKTTATPKTPGKTPTKSSRSKSEPIAQVVARTAPRPQVELPKLRGELPIPTATFYF